MTKDIDTVLRVVAERFGVSVAEIRSQRRSRQVVPARLVAAYLAHQVTERSPIDIGRQIGGRDHTNIVMYCRTVGRRVQEDEEFRRLVEDLTARVRERTPFS
jgi:chromosomal replication initiator protein